jgi:DNA-directed RNA polymerase specialized sigma24 family protein
MPENPVTDPHSTDLPEGEDTLVRYSQEDPAAFGPLFDFYSPRIYRYALHRLGNANDAEDVTSRVFTDALQSRVFRRLAFHYRPTSLRRPLSSF